MCAVTSRFEAPATVTAHDGLGAAGVHGAAEIGFVCNDGMTRLCSLYHRDPLRVLFPTAPANDVPQAVIATISGGLVGGDRLDIGFAVGPGAQALATAQAAEKVYRSTGADCRIEVRIDAGTQAWLEFLPHETILFEGARLRRRTCLDLAPGARAMVGEMLVFGRSARGERMTRGLVREAWEVHRIGRLVWADALHLDGDLAAPLAASSGFDGAIAMATLVYAAPDSADRIEVARDILAAQCCGVRSGATVVNGLLIARWLGRDALALRTAYGAFWSAFRGIVAGLPAVLPRIWHV